MLNIIFGDYEGVITNPSVFLRIHLRMNGLQMNCRKR